MSAGDEGVWQKEEDMMGVFELKDGKLVKKTEGEVPAGWEQDSEPVQVDETDHLGGFFMLTSIQTVWQAKGYQVLWHISDGVATMWTHD
jgi:hypothetical protein